MEVLLCFLIDQLLRQRWNIGLGYVARQLLLLLGAFGNLPALTAVFTGDNLRNTPPLGRFINKNILQLCVANFYKYF